LRSPVGFTCCVRDSPQFNTETFFPPQDFFLPPFRTSLLQEQCFIMTKERHSGAYSTDLVLIPSLFSLSACSPVLGPRKGAWSLLRRVQRNSFCPQGLPFPYCSKFTPGLLAFGEGLLLALLQCPADLLTHTLTFCLVFPSSALWRWRFSSWPVPNLFFFFFFPFPPPAPIFGEFFFFLLRFLGRAQIQGGTRIHPFLIFSPRCSVLFQLTCVFVSLSPRCPDTCLFSFKRFGSFPRGLPFPSLLTNFLMKSSLGVPCELKGSCISPSGLKLLFALLFLFSGRCSIHPHALLRSYRKR